MILRKSGTITVWVFQKGRDEALQAQAEHEAADQEAADEVIAKIDAIGTVEYTEASKAKIDDARNAYDALTDAQKALVTNAQTLTDAVARYNELKTQAETPTDPTDPTEPENPTEPTDPDHPSGSNNCPWDDVDHGTSFWGRLVRFFHSILYFFAHLFGGSFMIADFCNMLLQIRTGKRTSVFMRTDLIVKQNVIVSSVLQFFVCMKFFMENG